MAPFKDLLCDKINTSHETALTMDAIAANIRAEMHDLVGHDLLKVPMEIPMRIKRICEKSEEYIPETGKEEDFKRKLIRLLGDESVAANVWTEMQDLLEDKLRGCLHPKVILPCPTDENTEEPNQPSTQQPVTKTKYMSFKCFNEYR